MRKKVISLIIIMLVITLSACSSANVEYTDGVYVTITDGGISQKVTDVLIDNYYPGARVDVKYLITNNTTRDITPSIQSVFNVKPGDYSKGKDYVIVPSYYTDWVDIPSCGTLKSGQTKSYTLVLKIPNETTEKIPQKWAFQTVTAGNNGGQQQTATALWWRVNMR